MLVPAGVFVIGTIELKSNVTLHIAAQGKLLGSGDGKQYHAADEIPLGGDATLRDGNVGLIYAVNAENITVEGPGTIDGQGALFRSPGAAIRRRPGRGGDDRPYHLLFYQCKNLRVRDLFLVDSALSFDARHSKAASSGATASTSTAASTATTTASISSAANTFTSATATCSPRTTPARCSAVANS